MRLASDGTGAHHGWYCNYVEVTVTGPATEAAPYELEAVRDLCGGGGGVTWPAAGRGECARAPGWTWCSLVCW